MFESIRPFLSMVIDGHRGLKNLFVAEFSDEGAHLVIRDKCYSSGIKSTGFSLL